MLNFFRTVSVLEGLSYLAILSVTLGIIPRDYVFPLGMGHGVLFLLYLVLSLAVANNKEWSLKIWIPVFFASVIPFAFIPVELFLKKSSGETKKES